MPPLSGSRPAEEQTVSRQPALPGPPKAPSQKAACLDRLHQNGIHLGARGSCHVRLLLGPGELAGRKGCPGRDGLPDFLLLLLFLLLPWVLLSVPNMRCEHQAGRQSQSSVASNLLLGGSPWGSHAALGVCQEQHQVAHLHLTPSSLPAGYPGGPTPYSFLASSAGFSELSSPASGSFGGSASLEGAGAVSFSCSSTVEADSSELASGSEQGGRAGEAWLQGVAKRRHEVMLRLCCQEDAQAMPTSFGEHYWGSWEPSPDDHSQVEAKSCRWKSRLNRGRRKGKDADTPAKQLHAWA